MTKKKEKGLVAASLGRVVSGNRVTDFHLDNDSKKVALLLLYYFILLICSLSFSWVHFVGICLLPNFKLSIHGCYCLSIIRPTFSMVTELLYSAWRESLIIFYSF